MEMVFLSGFQMAQNDADCVLYEPRANNLNEEKLYKKNMEPGWFVRRWEAASRTRFRSPRSNRSARSGPGQSTTPRLHNIRVQCF